MFVHAAEGRFAAMYIVFRPSARPGPMRFLEIHTTTPKMNLQDMQLRGR